MKKIFLLLLSSFAIFAVQAQLDYDWANFARYEAANKRVQLLPQDSRAVVFMGNSITEQWYQQDSLFFIHNKYVNRGISGQTTSQMLVRFRTDVLALQPKVVVLLAGTNDIAHNTGYISLENILGNLISMADLAQAHHIKPVLCSLLPAFDYPWRREMHLMPNKKIPRLNAMIKAYAAQKGITYLDYFNAMKDDKNGMQAPLSKDGVHPNLKGNKIMEKLAQRVLNNELAQ